MTENQLVLKAVEYVLTQVTCNCQPEMEQYCQSIYRTTGICGSLLNVLPSKPGLELLLESAKLGIGCNGVGANLDQTGRAVSCALSIPDVCPGAVIVRPAVRLRRKRGGNLESKRPALTPKESFLSQIQLAAEVTHQVGNPLRAYMPFFQAPRPSKESVLTAFKAFFDALRKVLGVPRY